jgi:dipeptidyl aminopeptidase/acylaminoacyl peptidase
LEATATEVDRRSLHDHHPVVTEDRIYRYWKKWIAGGEIHHLFHLDLDGTITDLTPEFESVIGFDPAIGDVAVSPDGTEVAFSAVVDLAADRHQTAVFTVPVGGGTVSRLTCEAVAHERRPRYSPDGSVILYGVQPEWDFYADRTHLTAITRATGEVREIAADWDRSATGWEFVDDATIVLGAEDRGRTRLFRLSIDEPRPVPIDLPHSVHGARPMAGRIWARTESLLRPAEVIEISSGVTTGFNDQHLAELNLGAVEEIEFIGAGGAPVQAYVVYPPDFDPARLWPLVHNIHGGPHGVTGDSWHWRWNSQVFAAGGYVVAAVNFHGSFGWGDTFTRSIRGAWGDKPGADVMAATDHLLERGFIDESKMAVAGGSYGGYLVAWLTGVTDRFAAAICHAGVTDLVGQWASDITAGREKAIGGVPWESMDDVERWSPIAHTAAMTTPTLVIHGELDYRVVVTQGLVLYGVLKHKGVPARLVYYPDEGHWIEQQRNSIHWHGEFMGWLDRWLRAAPSGSTIQSSTDTTR